MAKSFTIFVVDRYLHQWQQVFGLSVGGPEREFPLLVGCSLKTPRGEVRDIPARWIGSPGLALWRLSGGSEFRTCPEDPCGTSLRGEVIFKLWRDDGFAECLAQTGWLDWAAPGELEPGPKGGAYAAYDLDLQEEQMDRKYGGRRDAWNTTRARGN